MLLINLSATKQFSIYDSLASMTALTPSDVATIDATTGVERDDDEEISYEETTHSNKIMYKNLV